MIAVGAPNTSTYTGAVYIFERQTDGSWDHTNTISESATGAQDTQINLDNYDWFGTSVGLYKDTFVVGAPKDDDGGTNKGAAYIFEKDSSDKWAIVNRVVNSLEDNSRFAESLEIYDDLLIISMYDNGGNMEFKGAAYIFEVDGYKLNNSQPPEIISDGYPNN